MKLVSWKGVQTLEPSLWMASKAMEVDRISSVCRKEALLKTWISSKRVGAHLEPTTVDKINNRKYLVPHPI